MGEHLQVIAVDDEEGMREGIKRILQKKGYDVDVAEDGETAIELINKKSYDLAFIDLKMPGISGFKVTEYINEELENNIVVVIVSALATVEAAVEVTRHGAFDFLVKPFTPNDLVQVTQRASRQCKLIREREKYLSELNSERNISRQMINSMQEGVVVLNLRAKPVLLNPKAEYFLGTRFSETLEKEDLFKGKTIRDAIDTIISSSPKGAKTRIFREEENEPVLQIRIDPLIRGDEIGGAIVIITDVTEEWKAEQDKNRFVSMVAHELKSPMAAIINYLDVIKTGMFDTQVNRIHELLDRCKIRGEALLELIQDLLYINKRDAGKIEKSIELLDLKEVLEHQMDFYRVQAENRKIRLSLEAEENFYTVKADRADLDRIFMNLISNGIKYNRENGELAVTMRVENSHILVEVRDSGIGMSEDDMKNLFQEFYRIRNKQTSEISGTGLGLATVKRVLTEYNGNITVFSEKDKGSTFTVSFPSAASS
jgi:signal transduction histidine kinase/DNA-binding response OmpR family regulator